MGVFDVISAFSALYFSKSSKVRSFDGAFDPTWVFRLTVCCSVVSDSESNSSFIGVDIAFVSRFYGKEGGS